MESNPNASRRPVAIDLFAGAGGLSLGFEMAGFDVVAAVEYDPVHAGTHLYNFPNTPVLCRDVRRITPAELLEAAREGWQNNHPGGEQWDGVVDVIVGGPSCQGFSAMGKQEVADDRNELVGEFVRLVEGIKPRAVVMENVPGILAPQFSELLGSAVRRLKEAGYSIADYSEPLDATEYGVPQRRKRVFIVGLSQGFAPHPIAKTHSEPVTVREAFAGLPRLSGREQTDGELLELSDAQRESYAAASNPYVDALRAVVARRHTGMDGVLDGCLVTDHLETSVARFEVVPQGGTDSVSRAWRLLETAPARTLRAGTGRERGAFSAARPLHPNEPRVITVREAARLHSFPDWFRFHVTNWHGHRQIGNAVPPLLARAVGESVRHSLGAALVAQPIAEGQLVVPNDALLRMNPSEATKHFEAADDEIPQKRQRSSVAIEPVPTA